MIEQSIIQKLLADASITTVVGSKIFFNGAPTNMDGTISVILPWIVVTNSGGMPKKLSVGGLVNGTEVEDTLTIYVDATDQYKAREIAQLIYQALHNYRGDLVTVYDTFLRVGSPRDLNGYSGVKRSLVTVYARYRIPTNRPV